MLIPKDFKFNNSVNKVRYIDLPASWNSYSIDGKKLGGSGYATFRLRILLSNSKEIKSIRIPSIYTAHRLWVNGEEISSQGIVTKTPDGAVAKHFPQIFELDEDGKELDLVLQVSNFKHRRGGIWQPLTLGNSYKMHKARVNNIISDLFLVGGLLIIGLYHLMFYTLRRKDKSLLFFGMMCVLAAVRIMMVGEILFLDFFPDASQELALKTEYLTFYLAIPLLLYFTYSVFPQEVSEKFCRIFAIVSIIYSIFVVVTPARIFSRYLLSFQITAALVFLYIIFALIMAAIRKREDALLVIGGATASIFVVMNDILFYEELSGLPNLFPLGIYIFILSQSYMLSRRFARAYETIENMKDKLISMDRLKDEFLASASHELMTPLSGIIGIAEAMDEMSSVDLSDEQRENISLIVSGGRRLTGLVRDILDFSRLKHKDIALNKKAININQVVHMVLSLCRPLVIDRDLDLYQDIPDNIPLVYADENRLEQILYNLIGNAIKFTAHGSIYVTAAEKGNFVEISVIDTGIGIPKEEYDNIFNSFTQVSDLISKEYGGTGLGLTITKELVSLHGGSVSVESEVGKGTKIGFTLPMASGNVLKTIEDIKFPFKKDLQLIKFKKSKVADKDFKNIKAKILIVDDEIIIQQVLSSQLESQDYGIICASNGEEALIKINEDKNLDLVILDVMMPGKSGYEVCKAIREKFSLLELPILLLTVRNSEEDIIEAFNSGANDYITKPFNKKEVLARVETLMLLKKSMSEALNSEIRFLQAQIKPHFLFNTLNTIMGFCRLDPEKARELLDEFSSYLRGKFKFKVSDDFVLLEEELNLIRAYLNIEAARYGQRMKVVYDLDTKVNYPIPSLILQPLVENAVRHGIGTKRNGGTIEIIAKDIDDCLVISIKDDGMGISENEAKSLLNGDKDGGGIGIGNVNKRLKKFYGKGLEIASEEGKGTTITLSIPIGGGRINND